MGRLGLWLIVVGGILVVPSARAAPPVHVLPQGAIVQARLVQQGTWLDTWLSSLWLPDAAQRNDWTIPIENTLPTAAVVAGVVETIKDRDGVAPPPGTLTADLIAGSTIAPGFGTLPVRIDRRSVAPQHYTGMLLIDLEGHPEHVAVPVDIAVRAPPLLPLVLVVLGILFGRLARYMRDTGDPLLQALAKIGQFERTLEATDAEALARRLANLRAGVEGGTVVDATVALAALQKDADTLADLRTLAASIGAARPDAAELRRAVEAARQDLAWGEGKPGAVEALRKRIADDPTSELGGAAPVAPKVPAAPGVLRRMSGGVLALLGYVSGYDVRTGKGGALVVAKATLALLFLLALVHLGMQKLYVESGQTFGAGGLADHLGLVMWGLSSEIVNKTLFSLRG
ncbi:MAG: hypothetical protein O2894_02080 [Planctomycetota bacterium]|nr:hypothetical protein [Planctomycetota bacterium]